MYRYTILSKWTLFTMIYAVRDVEIGNIKRHALVNTYSGCYIHNK